MEATTEDQYDVRAEANAINVFFAEHRRCAADGDTRSEERCTMAEERQGSFLILNFGCSICGASGRARFNTARIVPMMQLQTTGEMVPLEHAPTGARGWLSLADAPSS